MVSTPLQKRGIFVLLLLVEFLLAHFGVRMLYKDAGRYAQAAEASSQSTYCERHSQT